MDRASFTSESPGKPIKLKKGKWAFVPDPLPSQLKIDWGIASVLSETTMAIGRLEGYLTGVQPIQKIIRNILVFQEAKFSLELEGLQVDPVKYFHTLIGHGDEGKGAQFDGISLFLQAHSAGLEYLNKDFPPSVDLLLKLHSTIFQEPSVSDQAQLRSAIEANLGLLRKISLDFQYIPPPEHQLKMALYSLDKRFRHPSSIPKVIDFALGFYQLIAIQPFSRGNIAIAALLNNVLISNMLPHNTPSAPISPLIKAETENCSDAFINVVRSGDWGNWIIFYLKGLARQFNRALDTAERVEKLRSEYIKRLEKERVSAPLAQLVDELFLAPVITVNHASRLARVTFRAAQLNVDKLVGLEILRETTGQKRNRLYSAPDILKSYEEA
jgi:Fic family protein